MKRHTLTVRYVETIPEDLEEGVLYISKKHHVAIHLCACGCGEQTVTPLDSDGGFGWRLTEAEGGVTLRPSIGNWDFPCRSHYYITNNKVEWL